MTTPSRVCTPALRRSRGVATRLVCALAPLAAAGLLIPSVHAADARAAALPGAGINANQPNATADGLWRFLDAMPQAVMDAKPLDRPAIGRAVTLDHAVLRNALRAAPLEGTPRADQPVVFELPMPDGAFAPFTAVESPIMEPGLSAKFPDIRSYLVKTVEPGLGFGRIVVSDMGFHATLRFAGQSVYITRATVLDPVHHWVYWATDFSKEELTFQCLTADAPVKIQDGPATRPMGPGTFRRGDRTDASSRSGNVRSTYRLAMATTGEYAEEFGGGTVNGTMMVITSMVANLNQIYEIEVATRFILVANNDLIIQTDRLFDPYTLADDASASNAVNQTVLDDLIGTNNYDVGHVVHFTEQANGLAGAIGTICIVGLKGQGYSATDMQQMAVSPFTTNIVAHELGHCFGGRHNFNNCVQGFNSGPRDDPSFAIEPASGATIMSYAGICSSQNLQGNAFPMFNNLNFDQMYAYLSTGPGAACAQTVAVANTPPTVNAGPDRIIPSKTPFTLTAVGNDPDNQLGITYSWETRDTGPAIFIPFTPSDDNGESPLVRIFEPTPSPSRTVPRIEALTDPTFQNPAELLPQLARTMKWRVTVRDNNPGAGGIATDDLNLNVIEFAGPVRVLTPAAGTTVRGLTTITWDPANTNIPPVNTQNVRILLSTDGGVTFPVNLLNSTPNTGSAMVTLPSLTTIRGRIKIEAIDNVFFAMSSANFTVNPPIPGISISRLGNPVLNDRSGNGNSTGAADPGETGVLVSVPLINVGATPAVSVTGTLTSLTPTVTVPGNFGIWPDLGYGVNELNSTPFSINISPNHPCTTPINLRLVVSYAGGTTGNIDFTIPSGVAVGAGIDQVYSYVGSPVAIPDNSINGVNIPINVANFGTIADLNVRFGSTTCTAGLNDPLAALAHSFVGDLVMTLTSPQGTTVTLMNRPGLSTPSSGNNFCSTLLDDEVAGPTIQTITPDQAPYPPTPTRPAFRPAQALSAFRGQNANGTWILNISDRRAFDTGELRAVSLVLRPNNEAVCSAPAATGACCAAGNCSITNQAECISSTFNGTYQGNNVTCGPSTCPIPSGACCTGATCAVITPAACTAAAGRFIAAGSACNAPGNNVTPCCKADFTQTSGVSVQDIFDFLSAWFSGDTRANFNGGAITVQDIFDYLAAWFTGC